MVSHGMRCSDAAPWRSRHPGDDQPDRSGKPSSGNREQPDAGRHSQNVRDNLHAGHGNWHPARSLAQRDELGKSCIWKTVPLSASTTLIDCPLFMLSPLSRLFGNRASRPRRSGCGLARGGGRGSLFTFRLWRLAWVVSRNNHEAHTTNEYSSPIYTADPS